MRDARIRVLLTLCFLQVGGCFAAQTRQSDFAGQLPQAQEAGAVKQKIEVTAVGQKLTIKVGSERSRQIQFDGEIVSVSVQPAVPYALVLVANTAELEDVSGPRSSVYLVNLNSCKKRKLEEEVLAPSSWAPDGRHLVLETLTTDHLIVLRQAELENWLKGNEIHGMKIKGISTPGGSMELDNNHFCGWHSNRVFKFSAGCCGYAFYCTYDVETHRVELLHSHYSLPNQDWHSTAEISQ